MELLEGETLRHDIGGKPLKAQEVLELGIQIADALESDIFWQTPETFGRGERI
jgi:hypothetical protein